MSENPPQNILKVLLIGKRTRILEDLRLELDPQKWRVSICNNLDTSYLMSLDVGDMSVVAFGRALSTSQKKELAKHYTAQNSNLKIVQGLAPIPQLLAAQIEAATTTEQYFFVHNTTLQAKQKISVTLVSYRLNFLYQARTETKIFQLEKADALDLKAPFKHPGFVVARAGAQVYVLSGT